jgi:hypothetical protein
MGREAECWCTAGSEAAQAKALLETGCVILRGAIRRRWNTAQLQDLRIEGRRLCFSAADEAVALELGAEEAARWLSALNTPLPSLQSKLGISASSPAWVCGVLDDAALAAALKDATAASADEAAVLVAVARSPAELATALKVHADMSARAVWVVHPKGKGASLSDAQVRSAMRALDYVDNKTSAVSAALTATRYARSAKP